MRAPVLIQQRRTQNRLSADSEVSGIVGSPTDRSEHTHTHVRKSMYITRNTRAQWATCQVHLRHGRPSCARACQLTTFLIVTDTYIRTSIPHSEPRANALGNYMYIHASGIHTPLLQTKVA